MEIVFLKMLFVASVSASFRKHVYVQLDYTWHEAQQHCRDFYIDLSPFTTPRVEDGLKNADIFSNGKVHHKFWIGLYRNVTHWTWSGGADATNIPWDTGEPDDDADQSVASICWHGCTWKGWHNSRLSRRRPFFCFNLIVVEVEKTWEQAMIYCRQNHTELTSLASETEHLLALSKIQRNYITQRVWIGLRYMGDRWLWVDGDPLEYEAWPQGGDQDHQCPIHGRCGALSKEGLWENWDCREKLNFICY